MELKLGLLNELEPISLRHQASAEYARRVRGSVPRSEMVGFFFYIYRKENINIQHLPKELLLTISLSYGSSSPTRTFFAS